MEHSLGMSALEDFIEHFEKFATDSQDYGAVVSLWLQTGSVMNAKDPQKLAKSLFKNSLLWNILP